MTAKKSMTLAELWDYLDERFRWVAMDESGKIFSYTKEPKIDEDIWESSGENSMIPFIISDINPDCSQSLVERPKDWSKYVGCLGEFWDGDHATAVLGILVRYCAGTQYPFTYNHRNGYKNFRPYTVAEIEQLRDKAKEAGL